MGSCKWHSDLWAYFNSSENLLDGYWPTEQWHEPQEWEHQTREEDGCLQSLKRTTVTAAQARGVRKHGVGGGGKRRGCGGSLMAKVAGKVPGVQAEQADGWECYLWWGSDGVAAAVGTLQSNTQRTPYAMQLLPTELEEYTKSYGSRKEGAYKSGQNEGKRNHREEWSLERDPKDEGCLIYWKGRKSSRKRNSILIPVSNDANPTKHCKD